MNSDQRFGFLCSAFLIGAILLLLAHGADGFANGFYETTDDSNGKQIVDVAGNKWRVGPRLVGTNRYVEVVSRDNWNELFQLSICLPGKSGGQSQS